MMRPGKLDARFSFIRVQNLPPMFFENLANDLPIQRVIIYD
jgi:hypothetical protein